MNIIESNLKFHGEFTDGNIPKRIILHHAAGNGTVDQIHQEHLDKGWIGIGYHYYVRKDGNIYKGRPDCAIGAHCLGFNTNSLGICAEGNFMNETMSEVQKNALIELVSYLKGKYSITDVKGHKELNSTDCPGANYPLDGIKNVNATVVPKQVVQSAQVFNGDADIRDLQISLNAQGYTDENGNKLVEDGLPGKHTFISAGKCLVKRGAKGEIVKFIQKRLVKLGFSCGSCGDDGDFGYGTLVAVQNFQAKRGLSHDGIVGQNTWKALLGL